MLIFEEYRHLCYIRTPFSFRSPISHRYLYFWGCWHHLHSNHHCCPWMHMHRTLANSRSLLNLTSNQSVHATKVHLPLQYFRQHLCSSWKRLYWIKPTPYPVSLKPFQTSTLHKSLKWWDDKLRPRIFNRFYGLERLPKDHSKDSSQSQRWLPL